jgi:hypothetical protein
VYQTTADNCFTKRGVYKQQLIELQKERNDLVQAANTLTDLAERSKGGRAGGEGGRAGGEGGRAGGEGGRAGGKSFGKKKLRNIGQVLNLLETTILGNTTESLRMAFAFYTEFLKCR